MTELRTLRFDDPDGTGSVFFDATDANIDQLRFELRATDGGVGTWIFTRRHGRELARALWRTCQEPSTVKANKVATARPRPEANLQRNELTEESRRFPYVTWVPQKD